MLESTAPDVLRPVWGQEVNLKMQCVLEDRTVVEKDCKLVFVIGEGDVNQVNTFKPSVFSDRVVLPRIDCLLGELVMIFLLNANVLRS